MDLTTRRSISIPESDRSDQPDIPLHVRNVGLAADEDVLYNQGDDTTRLAAAHQTDGGRFWWTTDTEILWYDDGTNWHKISTSFTRGILADIPAADASNNGSTYQATDDHGGTIYISDGIDWHKAAPGLTEVPKTVARHSCKAIQSTPQSIPSDTSTVVIFDNEEWDTDGYHDDVTNNTRVTVPVGYAGIVLLNASAVFPNPSEVGSWGIVIRKNGSVYGPGGAGDYVTTHSFDRHPSSSWMDLAAEGDYYEILVHQVHTPSAGAATLVSAFLAIALLSV